MSGEVVQGTGLPEAGIAAAGTDAAHADSPRTCGDRGRYRHRKREHLLALALATGLSLVLLGPWILPRMSTWFLSAQSQDGSIFVWMFRWWPYALAHHLNPLYTTAAWAPGGINLAWVTSIPLSAIVMAPITVLFGPFASFNVVELAAPALASWTAYLLCRKIAGSFGPALAGGLCFGFSPYLMAAVGPGDLNLSQAFLVPVAAYLTLRLAEGSLRPRWFVPALGAVLGAQLYLSTEVFATMTLVGAVAGTICLVFGGKTVRRRALRAAGPAAAAYGVGFVIASPLLYVAFTQPVPYKPILFNGLYHGAHRVSDFLSYVIPGRFTILGGQIQQHWGVDGNPWYFGAPLIVLLIIFLITERRQRRTWLIAATLAVTLVLSIGDSLKMFGANVLPWRLVVTVMPLLGKAHPGELALYEFLLLGIVMAIWLARPARRRLRWALGALSLLAILPNVTSDVWARQVFVPPVLTTGAYHSYLAPGETIWVVDPHRSRQMIWQAQAGFSFRLAGGFFQLTPAGLDPAPIQAQLGKGLLDGATAADIRGFLHSHGVGAILMSEDSQATFAP